MIIPVLILVACFNMIAFSLIKELTLQTSTVDSIIKHIIGIIAFGSSIIIMWDFL